MSDVFTLGEYWKLTPTSLKIAICVNEYKQEVYDSISRIEQKRYKKNSWIWAIRCVSEAHGLMSSRTFGSAKCSSLREREFSEDKPPRPVFMICIWFVSFSFLFFFLSPFFVFFSPILLALFRFSSHYWHDGGDGGALVGRRAKKNGTSPG